MDSAAEELKELPEEKRTTALFEKLRATQADAYFADGVGLVCVTASAALRDSIHKTLPIKAEIDLRFQQTDN